MDQRFLEVEGPVNQVKEEFPEAWADLTSGDWQDEDGRTIRSESDVRCHVFYVMKGELWWDNGYEAIRWDAAEKMWD